MKKQPLFEMIWFFVPSFLYSALFTFHIFFFTKLNLKTQFEIEFLPPNNGGKKMLEKYPGKNGIYSVDSTFFILSKQWHVTITVCIRKKPLRK